MKTILDDESTFEKKEKKIKLTSNKKGKGIAYFLVMLIGGMIFSYFANPHWNKDLLIMTDAISLLIFPLLISIVVEAIRYLLHKRREQKENRKIERDPYWFQLLENTFAIWILTAFAFFLGYILGII
jgi:hypothetical protein